ncbi:MAG: bola-like protein-domain-containing protein [Benniella sp.]|nr:MAG: bola-like protein-domain-containing protein [Benniella sp.]
MVSLPALVASKRVPSITRPLAYSIASYSRSLSSMASQQEDGPITTSIRSKLSDLLNPTSFEIINESSQHAHHSAMRGVTSKETHFRINVVSEAFGGKSTIQRHRLIYGALNEEFAAGLHALSLNTKTPAEIAKEE